MIELISNAFGSISTTKQIYRKTRLRQITTDVIVSLSVYATRSIREPVAFKCDEFPALLIYNSNRVVSYFTEFSTKQLENSGINQTIDTSTIDDESLIKYTIIFDRDIFIDLNLSQYESTIRKLIKTISGV